MKRETEWIRCPACGNKTRDRIIAIQINTAHT